MGRNMDRGLIGVLLVCLVGSTIVVLVLFELRPSESVSLIRLDAFKEGVGRIPSYSLELLTRRPIQHLVLQFQYLVRVDEKVHNRLLSLLQSEGLLGPSERALTTNPKVSSILRMMEPFPDSPHYRFFHDSAIYESHLWQGGREIYRRAEYEIAVLDLHSFFEYLPESARPDAYKCHTVFAAFFHQENVSFYEGVSDFYLDRRDSVGEILCQAGNRQLLFENPRVTVPEGSEYVDVTSAPPFGTVSFDGLSGQETVKVFFTTRHLAGPAVLVTRVFVDGREEKTYYVFLGWPEEPY